MNWCAGYFTHPEINWSFSGLPVRALPITLLPLYTAVQKLSLLIYVRLPLVLIGFRT